MRWSLLRGISPVVLAMACAMPAAAAVVIDLSGDAPRLVREGHGDIRPFGFVKAALH